MCGTVMRGADALPGSKSPSRAKRSASEAGRSCVRPRARKGSRPASGRRGAVADDVRAQEVEPCHSSFENGEQSGGVDLRGGVGEAKGRGRGDCEAAYHAPGAVPEWRVTCVVSLRFDIAVLPQGGNRMRESCTYGSVRGARGNSRPYRAGSNAATHESGSGPEQNRAAPQ